jgi:hypothetical protein
MDHGGKSESTHKIFFENLDECTKFDAVEYFETDSTLLKNKRNRMRKSQLETLKLNTDENDIKKLNTHKKLSFKKLSEKIKNVESLTKISNTLSYQKHLIVLFKILNKN